ncbi:MAG TPA: hypothetical protein VEZ11_18880, partial [Thermoanaerobaculia bacterium]|nr:hypothetical protein [Thermoanaerobaculia bacterium]
MPDETSRPYVLKLRNELHRYAQDLLRENEKLRAVTASLESDRRQLELELLQARDAAELRDDSRRNVEILEKEMLRMAAELATARDERDRYNCELTTLRDNLSSIESENRKYVELYQEIEQHSSNLANLYVSSYQLHSTVAREEVLGRILEIVINLIGSEEVGIF